MHRTASNDKRNRPSPVTTGISAKSFARYEPTSPPSQSPEATTNNSTLNPNAFLHEPSGVSGTPDVSERTHSDIFETEDDDELPSTPQDKDVEATSSDKFEELPVEIQSLIERFLESLSLQTQTSSLAVDRLSDLYQSFYQHVETQISTHIAALSSKMLRDRSPAPSISSASSSNSRGGRKKHSLPPERRDTDQQMLSASDMVDRKKMRRQLDLKKFALEEAVERSVCERVYPRLWRHSSTEDGERDAKLRSRAAALAVVGVDLKELLSTAMTDDDGKGPDLSTAAKNEQDYARVQLAGARESLKAMNDARYPRAKLACLTAVHSKVVDFLSQMFPSTSSADEILPTLIYVIITSPPETISVVANMLFVQRFRNASRSDGEAAYCLTNLEAAISFLETVDLSSIRKDESANGHVKQAGLDDRSDSHPGTPRPNKFAQVTGLYQGLPPTPDTNNTRCRSASSPGHPRRLSSLLNTKPNVSQPFTAASDAVFNTADTVHAALDNSFKFLFGRLREKQAAASPTFSTTSSAGPEPPTPRTLADARRLVTEKTDKLDTEQVSLSEALTLPSLGDEATYRSSADRPSDNGKVLDLITGRRPPTATSDKSSAIRDESVSSVRSDNSAPNVPYAEPSTGPSDTPLPIPVHGSVPIPATDGSTSAKPKSISANTTSGSPPTVTPASQSFGAVESMRKFGDSLNPLKGFSMRGFGRGRSLSGSNITPPTGVPPSSDTRVQPVADTSKATVRRNVVDSEDKGTDRKKNNVDLSGVAPPVQRFVDMTDVREMNGFEVELLLRDYQRLAGVVRLIRK